MRLIDADALKRTMLNTPVKAVDGVAFDAEWFTRIADTAVQFADMVDNAPTIDAVPVVHGQFVKNETGVNRHCTACGAYLEDREYENHTVRFCYYCGAKIKGLNGDSSLRSYEFEREAMEADIEWIIKKATEFWRLVQEDKRPPLVF